MGEVARNYMINWDKKFLKKIKDLGLTTDLYARCVDDVLVSLNTINKGWDYCQSSNRMVFSEQKEKEVSRDNDV